MYLIVDISNARYKPTGTIIAQGKEPTYIHDSRETAEAELLRLQALDSFGEFILFQATDRAIPTMTRPDVILVTPIQP